MATTKILGLEINALSASYALTAQTLLGSITSASYATTSSFALQVSASPAAGSTRVALLGASAGTEGTVYYDHNGITYDATTNKLTVSGQINATFYTGSLLGTASYATQALSSSFATTASFALTSPLGNRVTQASSTSYNQYQAPAGLTNTIVFSANVLSTLGQIIDVDFLTRNNSGIASTMRLYINNSATTVGATQIGNFALGATVDDMLRFQHRFVVANDGGGNWNLIGPDAGGISNDFVAIGVFAPNLIGVGAATKSYMIVTLNQSSSLIAASINY